MGSSQPNRVTEPALVRSGAAMYAGVGCLGLLESFDGFGPRFSVVPALGALVTALAILLAARRVPRAALWGVGPLAMVGIAVGLALEAGPTDAAILYALPLMWVAHFYGRWATLAAVLWLGFVHGLALHNHPTPSSLDRWEDVMGIATMLAIATRRLTERIVALMEEQHLHARLDPLTGLLNRRAFQERLLGELARAERHGTELTAVAFDIDHFKAVNDGYGHAVGDKALLRVAAALTAESRESDVLTRVGGEEFLTLLPQSGREAGVAFAERVRARVADTPPGEPAFTLSAGVARTHTPSVATDLLEQADAALYTAKRSGRDRVVVATSSATEPSPAAVA